MIFKRKSRYKEYIKLRRSKGQSELRKIQAGLGEIDFNIPYSSEYGYDRSLSVKQFVLQFLSGKRLIEAILYARRTGLSVKFLPLPKAYQNYLIDQGVNISRLFCSLTFYVYCFIFWVYGVIYLLKALFKSYQELALKAGDDLIYFDKISFNNLPNPYPDGSSYDIITWAIQHFQLKEKIICHPIKGIKTTQYLQNQVQYKSNPISVQVSKGNFKEVVLKPILHSIAVLFSFKWDQFWLLKQDIEAIFYRQGSPTNKQLKKYIIPNHVTTYRPIWTYQAEQNGVEIITYFYSTSSEPKAWDQKEWDYQFYHLMNWPINLVMDKFQKDKLDLKASKNSINQLVSPICFSTNNIEIKSDQRIKIALFDIDPQRKSQHFGISSYNDYDYDEYAIHESFFEDLIFSPKSKQFKFYIKPKRKQQKSRQLEKYNILLEKLAKIENVDIINSDISYLYLTEKTDISISFPFTSPSIVAKNLHKKTAFYDPSGKIALDDPGAFGVKILNKKEEIQSWMESHLQTNN
ncbi:polysaccharide biosynthesis PFTS motif protein [Flavobacteriaceae bacterium]|nr:polysaccharide biosynthesis PFTS motif protein [Flavobacteriaceae bacterium]